MNLVEAIAAALGVVNVLLVVRRSIWNYPFGLATVAVYFFVFFQQRLYSDALLQLFFIAVQLYGWWAWQRAEQIEHGVAVGELSPSDRLRWAAAIVVAAGVWSSLMSSLTDAAAPFVDGPIAITSVAAQLLQSFRKVESWWLWILVDLTAIPLFFSRGLLITAGLYGIFLCLAVAGLLEWRRKATA
ncbi:MULTISPECIES: nicotinamide riboside transporter PnuC [Sphingomonas]|uniref:nicotinamide riboside transporter PnuC n=1 Tax=Sphingomonas TaxID=13687 RepID=UPI000DEF0DB6|nr:MULTISPECIES: nicotinamide riboside transporter PnuC [Sphingomonas]